LELCAINGNLQKMKRSFKDKGIPKYNLGTRERGDRNDVLEE